MRLIIFLTVFFSFTAFADPCGLEGTIDERIKSCDLAKGDFVLVTRSATGVEIFKDTKSGVIWGDRLTADFNHYGSQKACDETIPEAGLLKDIKWRLPTVREFEDSAAHGMKASLSRMYYTFWSSTPVKNRSKGRRRRAAPAQAFLWDGDAQKTDVADLKDAASVRCVGKI